MRGELTINLKALQENYKVLKTFCGTSCETAAVVKANAYGIGVSKAVPALFEAGARTFFVATLEEGVKIRRFLPQAHIYILNGFWRKSAKTYKAYNLVPVLNSIESIKVFQEVGGGEAILHFDTGMSRLGLRPEDTPDLSGIRLHFIMSHLTSPEETENPSNLRQLESFRIIRKKFPNTKASLANSCGIFLGADYRFELTRPGIALYGSGKAMKPVVNLSVPAVQIRRVKAGESAGYNETYTFKKDTNLVVVGAGYADGLLRTLSKNGALYWKEYKLPIRGRVSMDTIICDLENVPENEYPVTGDKIELIGENQSLDQIAKDAKTIPYEILTSLGSRYKRVYI